MKKPSTQEEGSDGFGYPVLKDGQKPVMEIMLGRGHAFGCRTSKQKTPFEVLEEQILKPLSATGEFVIRVNKALVFLGIAGFLENSDFLRILFRRLEKRLRT